MAEILKIEAGIGVGYTGGVDRRVTCSTWHAAACVMKFRNETALVKSRVQPMLGFKKFSNARRVRIGIEFMHTAYKG